MPRFGIMFSKRLKRFGNQARYIPVWATTRWRETNLLYNNLHIAKASFQAKERQK